MFQTNLSSFEKSFDTTDLGYKKDMSIYVNDLIKMVLVIPRVFKKKSEMMHYNYCPSASFFLLLSLDLVVSGLV